MARQPQPDQLTSKQHAQRQSASSELHDLETVKGRGFVNIKTEPNKNGLATLIARDSKKWDRIVKERLKRGEYVALDGLNLLSPEYRRIVREQLLDKELRSVKSILSAHFDRMNLTSEERLSFLKQIFNDLMPSEQDDALQASPSIGKSNEISSKIDEPSSVLALPTKAPELYAARLAKSENPVEFIKRVYEPWLGKGLDRPCILRLDKQLYNGLNQWRLRRGADDLNLPKKSEMVTREIEQAGPDVLKRGNRLNAAAHYRRTRSI